MKMKESYIFLFLGFGRNSLKISFFLKTAEEMYVCKMKNSVCGSCLECSIISMDCRRWSCFSLHRRLREDPFAVFQYLKGNYKQKGNQLFTGLYCDRTRENGSKLKDERFGCQEEAVC